MGIPYIKTSSISNRPSGGGSKLQGLPPTTNKKVNFVLPAIRRHSYGKNRTAIFYVNQLSGGVGRRSGPFVSGADGINYPADTGTNGGILLLHNALASPQSVPGAGYLTLNGNLAGKELNGYIMIESTTDESNVKFLVEGYDARGQFISDQIVGPGGIHAGPYNGLVLFSPKISPYYTYLIDKNATSENYTDELVYLHRWGPHAQPAASAGYLKTNGNMVYPCRSSITTGDPPLSSAAHGGRIIEYDWDGNVVWDWTIPTAWAMLPHHDIDIVPNSNNILLIVIENNSSGGTSDGVIEIEPNYTNNTATLVWQWRTVEHTEIGTNTDAYKFSTLVQDGPSSNDWNHFNAIYMSVRDTIYLSSRNWNEFYVIPYHGGTDNTGDILYRWGNPQNYGRGDESDQILDAQHGVNEISSDYIGHGPGNVILFNNGGQIGEPNPTSQILEIEKAYDSNGDYTLPAYPVPFGPTTYLWNYDLTEELSSNRQSGAFRLPNGHTFGISAQRGYLFEVNNSGHLIWSLTSTNSSDVQRAHQYKTDYLTVINRKIFGSKIFKTVTSIRTNAGTTGEISIGIKK